MFFLHVDLNKQEILVELGTLLKDIMLPRGKQLLATILGDCASRLSDADVGTVDPCSHTETDTNIFHAWLLPTLSVNVE